MAGEQFGEQDRAFINDCVKSTNQPYGEDIVIKRYSGIVDAGDPARGIQPKLGFTRIPVKAIVSNITQRDILYSGGIYQYGDITLNIEAELKFIDNKVNPDQNDRIEYRGHDYRIVGRIDPETLVNRDKLFVYVLRKIGNV